MSSSDGNNKSGDGSSKRNSVMTSLPVSASSTLRPGSLLAAVPTSARLESSSLPVSAKELPAGEQHDVGDKHDDQQQSKRSSTSISASQQQPNNPWIAMEKNQQKSKNNNRFTMIASNTKNSSDNDRSTGIQSSSPSAAIITGDIANESMAVVPQKAIPISEDSLVVDVRRSPSSTKNDNSNFLSVASAASAATSSKSGRRKNITRRTADHKTHPPQPKFTRLLETSGRCQNIWAASARILTCWFMHKTDPGVQQAWREKVGLCLISFFSCVFLGYFTFFYQSTSCPPYVGIQYKPADLKVGGSPGYVRVNGLVYDMNRFLKSGGHMPLAANVQQSFTNVKGMPDLSNFFKGDLPGCKKFFNIESIPLAGNCSVEDHPELTTYCHSIADAGSGKLRAALAGRVYYEWKDVINNPSMTAYNGKVLDLRPYDSRDDQSWMRRPDINDLISKIRGKDGSLVITQAQMEGVAQCLVELYYVADLEIDSIMCIAANTILSIVLVMILGLIIVRFVLAIAFDWFLSWQLGKIEENQSMFAKRKSIINVLNVNERLVTAATHPQSFSLFERVNFKHQYKDLYTMCLVTCYSEDEAGLRTTLDSLAMTNYTNEFKMVFIVADGVVKGSGNPKPTGDIILGMIDLDPVFHGPIELVDNGKGGKELRCANDQPQSYVAIGQGSKRHNMAKTYCGTYTCQGRSVAVLLVYKCGTPAEASGAKPGNRGKRDSQILLMDFLSKTMFDEPFSPFQFDLFCKWTHIMTLQNGGRKRVTPDLFEIVLMVDADTKVLPDALTKMVAVMQRDPTVMGLCGETRIMNKNESWVTMIQVFEYYISHHLAKAFESIFGGVTCLPGCFCMYRIKSPKPIEPHLRDKIQFPEKECAWVPIITNPDILSDYSASEVDTLHKKNLLLLGEDRFLSTLMLRKFPKRKMMFVPKALCRTTVPAKFSVLLSQRRRWINSTIHNLMELVLVRELCGTFCFSMQFVVFLELVGTITLPAAICFTMVLIGSAIKGPDVPWVPLGLLFAILGLPAVLIFITSFNYLYIGYLFVYLLALPIWNFVLPTYAFWHFDDFSWGITRPVAGEKKGADSHGHGGGETTSQDPLASIPMRRWVEYEKSRLRILAEREQRDPIGYIPGGGDSADRIPLGAAGVGNELAVEKSSTLASDKKRRLLQLATRTKDGSTVNQAESTAFEATPTSASLTPRPAARDDRNF